MAWVERLVTRTAQPQDGVSIDWNNPVTRGLLAGIDAVGSKYLVLGSSLPSGMTRAPRERCRAGVARRPNTDFSIANVLPALGSTASISMLHIGVIPAGVATPNAPFTLSHTGGSEHFGFRHNDGVTEGRVQGRIYIGGTVYFGGSVTLPVGSVYLAVATHRHGVGQALWLNGTKDPVTTSATGGTLGNPWYGAYLNNSAVGVLNLVWNRALSDDEIKSLSANPWQIFEPEVQMVWEFEAEVSLLPAPQGRYEERLVTRTSQPQDGVGIDWGNPLTKGLVEVYNPVPEGSSIDGVTYTNHTGGPSRIATTRGVVTYASTASVQGKSRAFSRMTSAAEATMLAMARQIGPPSATSVYGGLGSSDGQNPLFMLGSGATPSQISFRVRNTAGTQQETLSALGQITSGTELRIVGSRSESQNFQNLYSDGVKISTSAATAIGEAGYNTFAAHGLLRTTFGLQASSEVSILLLWSRALSDAEVQAISTNPWQIYEPDVMHIWAPVASADVTLPTLVQPSDTLSAGAWTATGAASLHGAINEGTPSAAEYISVNSASTTELLLAEAAYPGTANQTLAYRASSLYSSTLTVTLKQGATTIMSRTHALTLTDTLYTQTLTSGEIALITAGPISVVLTTS